ncbi:MAG: SDR family oxidoreductase [Candidatus Sericytochromatia bacterium]
MKIKKVLAILAVLGFAFYKIKEKYNKTEGNIEEKYILVTGASTGIGRGIVEDLADKGYNVFATVRKDSDFETLANLSSKIIPVKMDVTDYDSILKAKEIVKEKLGTNKLYSLINNAGIAVSGPMELISVEELRRQFEVNYFGVVNTTQVFFELLDKNNSKIINMSSVGGKVASPFMGPYNASKFALEAMSDSLRRELFNSNIEVIVIQPGMIETPIWDKAEEIDVDKYRDSAYIETLEKMKDKIIEKGKNSAPVELVSRTIIDILGRKTNKTRYWVSGAPIVEVFIPRMLPDKAVDFIVNKFIRL